MITDIKIVAGTAANVVTLAKAKKQLKLESDFTDEDDLIQSYIDASVEICENFIGGYINEKTITFSLNQFDNPLSFQAFPLKEVVEVKYFDLEDQEQTLATEKYKLTSPTNKIYELNFIGDLPSVKERLDAVKVVVKVGMESVPKPISQASLLMLSDMYERREDRSEVVSTQAMVLLRPFKKY